MQAKKMHLIIGVVGLIASVTAESSNYPRRSPYAGRSEFVYGDDGFQRRNAHLNDATEANYNVDSYGRPNPYVDNNGISQTITNNEPIPSPTYQNRGFGEPYNANSNGRIARPIYENENSPSIANNLPLPRPTNQHRPSEEPYNAHSDSGLNTFVANTGNGHTIANNVHITSNTNRNGASDGTYSRRDRNRNRNSNGGIYSQTVSNGNSLSVQNNVRIGGNGGGSFVHVGNNGIENSVHIGNNYNGRRRNWSNYNVYNGANAGSFGDGIYINSYSNNGDSHVHAYVGDIVVFANSTIWKCDRIYCPLETDRCDVTKQKSSKDPTIILHKNICYGNQNEVLNQRTYNERASSTGPATLKLSVYSNGNSFISSDPTLSNADLNRIHGEVGRQMRELGENLQRQMHNLQLHLQNVFSNMFY